MARSDFEDTDDSRSSRSSFKMVRNANDTLIDKSNGTTIHSGHFMVSCLNDEETDDDQIGSVKGEDLQGYDFASASKETQPSYKFTDQSKAAVAGIDTDLSKLFECMTLAYSGKLTSPKWKNFKGLKLSIKDKVRLNNIIWREWHAQFVLCEKPKICQFEPPISDRTHAKPEAVVLEGKYWKRKLNSVTSEYMKWRTYHKKYKGNPEDEKLMRQVASHAELLERVGQTNSTFRWGQTPNACRSPTDLDLFADDDFMDLSDTLFSTLTQGAPFAFPTARELSRCQLTNADIMQPGLIGLQPSIEEYMDTLEPLPSLQEMMGGGKSHQRGSSINTSMLVDPIVDPFFNDTGAAASLSTDFLATSNSPSPSVGLEQQQQALQQQQEAAAAAIEVNSSATAESLTADILHQLGLIQAQQSSQQTAVHSQRNQNAAAQLINLILQNGLAPNSTLDLNSTVAALRQVTGPVNTSLNSSHSSVSAPFGGQTGAHIFTATTVAAKPYVDLGVLMGRQRKTTIIPPQERTATPLQNLLQGINQPTSPLMRVKSETVQSSNQVQQIPATQAGYCTSTHVRHHSGGQAGRGRGRPKIDNSRRASTGSVSQPIVAKQFVQEFKVPETPTRYKQQNIKIAPAPSQSQKSTFLTSLGNASGNQSAVQLGGAVTVATVAKSVTSHNKFLAQLLQGQDTAVPNVALKHEPINYPLPKLTTTHSIGTQPSSMAFTLATPQQQQHNTGRLMYSQPSTVNMVDLLSSNNISLTTAALPHVADSSAQYRVSSPTGSVDSDSRSRHASNESEGSANFISIKDEKAASPGRPLYGRRKNELDPAAYKEHRRASHISAEQKRRFNIKYGFDTLCQLVPTLTSGPSSKVSKAAILQKAAEYARKMKTDRARMHDEAEILKREIESLNRSISTCQSQLPATGVPVSGQRVDRLKAVFEENVRNRTLKNWKYWIFSMIVIGMQADGNAIYSRVSLFDTYNNSVSTASIEEFCRTVLCWLDQHCSLVALRPAVLPSMTKLSTSTSILTNPSRVPEEATKAVLDLRDHCSEID